MNFPAHLPVPHPFPLRGGPVLRWGVLAPGAIARKFTSAIHAHTDQRVHAVGSRSLERAQAFATEHGVARAYGSYEELVADPTVDIVYVAPPHSEHRALALLAIAAGKHVLVEKPIALSAAEAREIAGAARAARVFAMEAMWPRYLPQNVLIGQLLADGVLGDVRLVTADFGKLASTDPAGKAYNPALGGGGILDLGVYTTWFSHFALGTPTRVAASGSLTETGVDAQSTTVLDFASGAQSIMSVNVLAATSGRATISGSLARIEVDPKFIYPSGFDLIATDGSLLRFDDDSGLRVHDGLAWQAAGVARHIADGMTESPWHPLDRSIAMMETIDEVRVQLGYAP